tara:strand:- start:34705 stop:35715 length:1011 start_codon:yes stop_codon:yes gene_type:complete
MTPKLKPQDFASNQDVRWCPGCGDYAVLKTIEKVLPELNIPKKDMVFVSGIGCASRFPYYLDTYGFHTIHGRAPTIATGVKLAKPELSVWVVTGDGDGFSIGTNHLIHLMRRNIDINILLFNNQVYGLTKGQYSPTSQIGLKTKSSPLGSLERPLSPINIALASNCSFVARAIDVDHKGLSTVLKQAVAHKGTSFIEIYQNCHVFNDGAFESIRDKAHRASQTITLEANQPLLFGAENEKGLVLEEKGVLVKNSQSETDKASITKYQATQAMAMRLNQLDSKQYPVPIGVFYQDSRPCLEQQMHSVVEQAKRVKSVDLQSLLLSGNTWEIEPSVRK